MQISYSVSAGKFRFEGLTEFVNQHGFAYARVLFDFLTLANEHIAVGSDPGEYLEEIQDIIDEIESTNSSILDKIHICI